MFLMLKVHVFAIYKNADAVDSPPYNFEFVLQDNANFSVLLCAENLIPKGNHADPPNNSSILVILNSHLINFFLLTIYQRLRFLKSSHCF